MLRGPFDELTSRKATAAMPRPDILLIKAASSSMYLIHLPWDRFAVPMQPDHLYKLQRLHEIVVVWFVTQLAVIPFSALRMI